MVETPESAGLTDEELLARVAEAEGRLREAERWRDGVIVDAMCRGLNQSVIAEAAGVNRRSLFKISDREYDRRQAEESGA